MELLRYRPAPDALRLGHTRLIDAISATLKTGFRALLQDANSAIQERKIVFKPSIRGDISIQTFSDEDERNVIKILESQKDLVQRVTGRTLRRNASMTKTNQ